MLVYVRLQHLPNLLFAEVLIKVFLDILVPHTHIINGNITDTHLLKLIACRLNNYFFKVSMSAAKVIYSFRTTVLKNIKTNICSDNQWIII